MGGPSARTGRDLVLRIERVCAQPLSLKTLRQQVIAELRGAVRFDAYNFPLTDPVSRVATAPLADVPGLPWRQLPELIRWRYLTRICRWDAVAESGQPATSLCAETGGHLDRSALWRRVQRDLGVTDTAIVVFFDRYGAWGLMDLWRIGGPPFPPAEVQLLASLAEPVTAGLRRATARTFGGAEHRLLPVGPAVIILDGGLQVRTQTDAAGLALLRLNPPDEPIPPIPAAAYNIGAALVAAEQGIPIGPAWSRVHLGGCRWVTVKASRLGDDIAVSIEPSGPDERLDVFARSCGLSDRESQILGLLCQGLDTREIAARTVLSEHTATDHIKAILAKTGARTRQVLLARALGPTAGCAHY